MMVGVRRRGATMAVFYRGRQTIFLNTTTLSFRNVLRFARQGSLRVMPPIVPTTFSISLLCVGGDRDTERIFLLYAVTLILVSTLYSIYPTPPSQPRSALPFSRQAPYKVREPTKRHPSPRER